MQTIKVILEETGRVANLKKDFPLYVGSYQNKLLNVLVPKSILAPVFTSHYIDSDGIVKTDTGAYSAVKIGMTFLNRNGVLNQSTTYFMRFLKTTTHNGKEYYLYERKLPKEFTLFEGQGENAPRLIVNVVNVLVSNEIAETLSVITSQYSAIDVMYSAELNNEPEYDPTDMEILSSQVNFLAEQITQKPFNNESMLLYNIDEPLPEYVTYNKDGYKSIGVLFVNESFELKTTISGFEEEVKGSIMVTNYTETEDAIIQTETFYYPTGSAVRTIELSNSLQTIKITDWSVSISIKQRLEDASKFLFVDENGNIAIRQLIIPEEVEIVDNLESDKNNASLSARQGKVLRQKIEELNAYVISVLNNYYTKDLTYNKEEVNTLIANHFKNYYTKAEVDNIVQNLEVDLSDYYTKSQVDTLIKNVEVDLTDYYTKAEVDNFIQNITNNATTITIRSWDEW